MTEVPQAIPLPQPPRVSGDAEVDTRNALWWLNEVYRILVVESTFLRTSEQAAVASDFDPASLPDPASTTLAQAQSTANEALTLANAVDEELGDFDLWAHGTAVIAEANTAIAVSLPAEKEQPDTAYGVVVVAETGTVGTPIGAFVIEGISSKTTTGFTIDIVAAPGSGKSVTYIWFLRR